VEGPDGAATAARLGHPPLVERIRAEIAATGTMTFARFMELALYEPGLGYYRRSPYRATRRGDFLTAPETDPIWGRALAVAIAEIWQRLDRPEPFVLRDAGAGTGALGIAVLERLRDEGSDLWDAVRYEPLESGPDRVAFVRERFAAAGLAGRLRSEPGPFTGVVVANELLDALPVHRLEATDGGIRELYVAWDGEQFVDAPGELSDAAFGGPLAAIAEGVAGGTRTEVAPGVGHWLADAAAGLERGALLLIDYGGDRSDLVQRMPEGTVRRYRAHHVDADPYGAVGESDLTAHVAWDDVEAAIAAAGLDRLARTTQAALLAGCGIGELLYEVRMANGATSEAFRTARTAVYRFLDPRQMGRFVVGLAGRGLAADPPLRSFAANVP
jgi:SAM-dependent MidA family methyltransferase